jgi:hypothetical protein
MDICLFMPQIYVFSLLLASGYFMYKENIRIVYIVLLKMFVRLGYICKFVAGEFGPLCRHYL